MGVVEGGGKEIPRFPLQCPRPTNNGRRPTLTVATGEGEGGQNSICGHTVMHASGFAPPGVGHLIVTRGGDASQAVAPETAEVGVAGQPPLRTLHRGVAGSSLPRGGNGGGEAKGSASFLDGVRAADVERWRRCGKSDCLACNILLITSCTRRGSTSPPR
eukprot:Hpha_TRINITY_DN16850_c1_g5::TRINITY_DN16850_c1_g5_i1::g.152939::m.152939